MPDRAAHWLVLGLLAALALVLYWPIFAIEPLGGDNFYILAWADAASGADLWKLDPAIYPEWRPLPFLAIWLEHQLVQLRAVALHHGVNLGLWIACAWLVYRIVDRLCGSRYAGALAAVLLVSDPRAMPLMIWIVDRQTSMACVFGLFALHIAVGARDRRLTRREGVMVMGGLLGAALSKEYGLAFGAAFMIYGACRRSPDTRWAAAALGCYAVARLVFADGAFGRYCEDMGFLGAIDQHCVDVTTAATWSQMAYNVAAAVVATPLHGVFDPSGTVLLDHARIATTFAVTLVSMLGLIRGHRITRLAALVVLGNAFLAFMIFRSRNLVVGECALAILTGVGIVSAQQLFEQARARVAVMVVVAALIGLVVSQQVLRTQDRVFQEVESLQEIDPCDSVQHTALSEPFIEKVSRRFEAAQPACIGSP